MKKLLLISAIIIVGTILYVEKRSFYCINDNRCITVWKTFGNTCYIMPYKYYGLLKPSDNYIVTTNTTDLYMFWSDSLENSVIVNVDADYKIINDNKNKITIHDYRQDSSKLDAYLYHPSAVKFSDVRKEVSLISIYIKEDYATDKNGKKL